jgi:hypothetical protein
LKIYNQPALGSRQAAISDFSFSTSTNCCAHDSRAQQLSSNLNGMGNDLAGRRLAVIIEIAANSLDRADSGVYDSERAHNLFAFQLRQLPGADAVQYAGFIVL